MAAACPSPPINGHFTTLFEVPGSFAVPTHQSSTTFQQSIGGAGFDIKDCRYPPFATHLTGKEHRRAMGLERVGEKALAADRPWTAQSDSVIYERTSNDPEKELFHDRRMNDEPPSDALPWSERQQLSDDELRVPSRNTLAVANDRQGAQTGDAMDRMPSNQASSESRPRYTDNPEGTGTMSQQGRTYQDEPKQNSVDPRQASGELSPYTQMTPRHPSVPGAGNAVEGRLSSHNPSPIVPASAAPSYKPFPVGNIPLSTNNRALAQQPTYITPPAAPDPLNPIYSPGPPRVQEEICVECAMRDQDMADVDVTSPGMWDRESDVYFIDLVRKEMEEEADRAMHPEAPQKHPADPNRPRSKGGKLTEHNVKIWLSMNPRESQGRHQTIDLYVKTQTALLEAEALARARAMQESRLLENKMRDAYDQLRRSTYDLPNGAQQVDDSGGRLKAPRSAAALSSSFAGDMHHSRHPSRDVTLLENGMLVEHVDVRKEEREERERRRKEERRERSRARKSSRGSAVDVTSMYSTHSPLPHPDSGFHTTLSTGDGSGNRPMSRYSQSSSRPMSVSTMPPPLTPPPVRPSTGRLHSQVSLADTYSLSSASMNRTSRFFTFRNWSNAWKSRESFAPSGMSGSMMDMHVALDNESHQVPPPVDIGSDPAAIRLGEQWPRRSISTDRGASLDRPKKKKGLAKIWKIFTGGKQSQRTAELERTQGEIQSYGTEDDLPLAPPPPLSYLVNRSPGDRVSSAPRHVSTPSLPTSPTPSRSAVGSPPIVTPPTGGSSLLPTPTSALYPWAEPHIVGDGRKGFGNDFDHNALPSLEEDAPLDKVSESPRSVHHILSEPDMRQRAQETSNVTSVSPPVPPSIGSTTPRPMSVMSLQKSLPPLPDESQPHARAYPDQRPHTAHALESPGLSPTSLISSNGLLSPQPGFRTSETRRQSFGGVTTRPNMPPTRTFPMERRQREKAYNPASAQYAEFGDSRYSLSRLEDMARLQENEKSRPIPSKRRSKFGLASLLGKISHIPNTRMSVAATVDFSGSRPSDYDVPHEVAINGRGGPRATYKATSRMSVASRKAIEELVDQDPEFVAYRYPSVDQSVDLLR